MKTYINVPKDCVSQELQDEIISQLPEPQEYPGLKFTGYSFKRLLSLNLKDEDGNTDNTARAGGTGKEKESLGVSLARGIDVTEYTPETINDDNLQDGFNRVRELINQGYEFWVFANYEYDAATRTEFQQDDEDALDDSRLSANVDNGKKPHTAKDITNIAVKKLRKKSIKFDIDAVKTWVDTLNHNFTPQTVGTIAKNAIDEINRAGNIEFYSREDAEAYVSNILPEAAVLNTNSNGLTRVLRTFENMMQNYVTTGDTLPIVLYSTGATSHGELDDEQERTIEWLKSLDNLVLQYAMARMTGKKDPYSIDGAIPQKIGVKEDQQNGLVVL
jgi:hypothetical protein